MKRHSKALLTGCLFIALLLTGPAVWAAPQVDWDAAIDIELKAADLVETLTSFARISGAEADIDPAISGDVTMTVDGEKWPDALDRLCRQHTLDCRWLTGEPAKLRVLPATGFRGFADNINLSLRGADLLQVLQTFEVIVETPVRIEGEFNGKFSIELTTAPWPLVLEEICALGGCSVDWSKETVIVRPSGVKSSPRVNISLVEARTTEVLASVIKMPAFERLGPLELQIEGDLAPTFTAELRGASWVEVLDSLCATAACQWKIAYGAPSRLQISATDDRLDSALGAAAAPVTARQQLAKHPGAATPEQELHAGLTIEGGEMIRRTVRFTWTRPIHRLPAGPNQWWHLAWIPFAANHQVVLASVVRCHQEGTELIETFAPLSLPLQGTWRRGAGDLDLELSQPEAATSPLFEATSFRSCEQPAGKQIEARLRPSGQGDELAQRALKLDPRLGSYLLVSPLGNPRGELAAAVVALGHDQNGVQTLALVKPNSPGPSRQGTSRQGTSPRGATVERLLLAPGDRHQELFQLEDGSQVSLDLTLAD